MFLAASIPDIGIDFGGLIQTMIIDLGSQMAPVLGALVVFHILKIAIRKYLPMIEGHKQEYKYVRLKKGIAKVPIDRSGKMIGKSSDWLMSDDETAKYKKQKSRNRRRRSRRRNSW